MPTQPNPSVTTNPHTAVDGTSLDPTALTLAKSIRAQEVGIAPNQNPSLQDYTKMGDGNKSSGIAQWLNGPSLKEAPVLQPGQIPANFVNDAKQYGLDPTDFSPTNQDKVLYARIHGQLKKGLAPSEIAAIQNGAQLVDGKYVAINPDYAAAIKRNYEQITQQTSATPNGDISDSYTANASTDTPTQPQPSLGQQALGLAGKVGDFFFPAVKDIYNDVTGKNDKTALQQAGDVGLSALSLIPGLGEAGVLGKAGLLAGKLGLAAKGAEAADVAANAVRTAKVGGEIATKGTQTAQAASTALPAVKSGILGTIGKGAAAGYGSDVASKLSQGNTNAGDVLTPGLGTVTGGALGAGSVALGAAGKSLGAKWVNSLVKPLMKGFAYGKNPGRAVAEEGIVGNSLDDLAHNIGQRRQEIGTEIGKIGDSVPQLKINLNKVSQYDSATRKTAEASILKPLDDVMAQAAKNNNPAIFTRVQQTKKALVEELGMGTDKTGAPAIISKGIRNFGASGYKDAQALKEQIGDMTQWTGNPSDDKAINAALQKVWGNISDAQKKGLASINPALRTRLEALNQRYGDLTSAEVATKYREAIHGRQNLISLGDKIMGGTGLMTGLLTGGPVGAALGTAAATGASHILGSTAAKTRIARALARAGGASSLVKKPPVTKGLVSGILKTTAIRSAASKR